ncbi:hypothetical protein DVW02_06230 [Clostridium botulinum]|nr:hypothetical protein [Clostridium botulinum]
MSYNMEIIEDDEHCPCGSGLKFVECCNLNITNSPQSSINQFKNDNHITSFIRKKYKESNISLCLHPKHEECVSEIIKAHSLQNNGILSKLEVNNHLMVISHVSKIVKTRKKIKITEEYINNLILNSSESFSKELKNELYKIGKKEIEKHYGMEFEGEVVQPIIKYEVERKGKNEATIFTGFCKYHDSSVFSPIEDFDYNEEAQQDFLFAYRAFAEQYHEKLRAINEYKNIFKNDPGLYKNIKFILDYRYIQIDDGYMSRLKEKFDQAIINEDYNILETVRIRLPKAYDFAVTAMIAPEIDLEGNTLNDKYLLEENVCKSLYLTIFPTNVETVILVSWLKEDSDHFKHYKNQILGLSRRKLKCYLNNLIPAYTPNIVLGPRLWEKQSESGKNKFLKSFEIIGEEIENFKSAPAKLSEKRKKSLKSYNKFLKNTLYDLFK